ncbi:MAG: DUF721 domain-containing protein [Bacteroidales bacterium]|nr:DUF721 domain-containing protein [Bacteroidales bacterium]
MQRRNEQSIGEILRQYLKITQLDNVVFADRIATIWEEALGNEIARQTDRIFLREGALFIQLKSPSLKAELNMRRTLIANLLNEKLGNRIIKNVIIR